MRSWDVFLQTWCWSAVAYLGGGPRCDAPFGPTMKIFYRRLYMKRCIFCRFPARIAKFDNVWWSFFILMQYAIKITVWDCIWHDAVIFCDSKFQKKNGQICDFHWTFKSKKCFSFRGQAPWLPDQGFCPWTPLGAPLPDLHYRLVLCALAMPPFAKS